ncbi:DMT family transporter [Neisseriaceae bacterium CLB008]|nr:DMT family transporter [Neisseriaceae bacterium]
MTHTASAWLTVLLISVALFAGAVVPFQAASNATLGRVVGHPLLATFISLSVSLVLTLIALVALKVSLPSLSTLSQVPSWAWLGGVAGVIYLSVALILTPKLGVLSFMMAVMAGQLMAAMLLDHFGLMGLNVKPVTLWRLVGLVLVFIGMFLPTFMDR